MARVLGPNGVAITAATGGAPTRASGEDFGAQVGAATQQFGRSLESLGKAAQLIQEKQQTAQDSAYLDKADLELDMTYGRIREEEKNKATSGAEGMFQSVRTRLEQETDPTLERLREQGFRPSDEAVQKAKSIALRRQHQHLTTTVAYENNERVRHFGAQLDNTLATIANSGAASGDLDSALTRAEQSVEAYKGILPPGELAQMREKAAKHFYEQVRANADPETVDELMRKLKPPAPEGSAPAKNDAIGRASQATGVPDEMLRVFAKIESGGDAEARTGSYKGLFQLSDAEFNKHGGGKIFNADDNAMAAARKLRQEAATFQEKYGRAPTATDLYLVHQQGEAGYGAHMQNPNAPAWENMASTGEGRQKGDKWAKLAIWGNIPTDIKKQFPGGVESVTSADFIRIWDEKIKRFGGGGAMPMGDDSVRGAFARTLSEKAPEIEAAVEKQREKRANAARAQQILTGAMLVDPNSTEDRKTIDKAFEATDLSAKLGASDPQAAAAVTALAQKTGYVPESAMTQLRAMSVNGDAEQKIYAFETSANLMREKPGIFEGSDKVKRLKDDASLYETYTTEMGLPAQQAIQRIDELRTPEFEKRREAMKKESGDFMKEVTGDELAKEFDGWFSTPDIGGSPGQSAVIVDTYRDLVKEHYIRTGDKEVARSMAKKDLVQTYAVSEVTGKKRLMRNPPEKYYPAIEPRAGKAPDHSYFTDQLKASVKEASGQDVPLDDIFLEPVPQTNSDIRAGRYPGYGVVWFENRDGVRVMQSAPGMVFRADVKAEQQRQTTNREERFREERRREVERQKNLDEGAWLKRGIQDLMTPKEQAPPANPEDLPFAF